MAVADLDALHSHIANDTCPGPLRRNAQPVNQRAPSAVYVVDGMPERPLHLLDEQADQRQLVYRIQQVGTQEPERIHREGAQLASLYYEGPFRNAVVVRDAELL